MTNRVKVLDLIASLNNNGWKLIALYGGDDQNHLQEKEIQLGKMVV